MQPGDIIEWVYKRNKQLVKLDEELYSTSLDSWVRVGGKSLLISITDTEMTWFHFDTMRVLHARVDDGSAAATERWWRECSPRTCG